MTADAANFHEDTSRSCAVDTIVIEDAVNRRAVAREAGAVVFGVPLNRRGDSFFGYVGVEHKGVATARRKAESVNLILAQAGDAKNKLQQQR